MAQRWKIPSPPPQATQELQSHPRNGRAGGLHPSMAIGTFSKPRKTCKSDVALKIGTSRLTVIHDGEATAHPTRPIRPAPPHPQFNVERSAQEVLCIFPPTLYWGCGGLSSAENRKVGSSEFLLLIFYPKFVIFFPKFVIFFSQNVICL